MKKYVVLKGIMNKYDDGDIYRVRDFYTLGGARKYFNATKRDSSEWPHYTQGSYIVTRIGKYCNKYKTSWYVLDEEKFYLEGGH